MNFITLSDILIIIIIIIYSLEFFMSALADGLSQEFEWQQVSRTLLSNLTVLNNSVVWMVSTRPPSSYSSSPFNNSLVTAPKALITIGIIITYYYHYYFQFLCFISSFFLGGELFLFFLYILFLYYLPLIPFFGKWVSSSSCRAASTDIPDPLSPLFPIVHRLWLVFRATSRILT